MQKSAGLEPTQPHCSAGPVQDSQTPIRLKLDKFPTSMFKRMHAYTIL